MITDFKEFEAYSGAGKTIGFRYSKPTENEANHYKIHYLIYPLEDGIPNFNRAKNINKSVPLMSIKSLIEKIKTSLNKVELDYIDVLIEPQKIQGNIWANSVLIDCYCYSEKEVDSIFKNVGYILDMAGYDILDFVVSTPNPHKPKRMGFRYSDYKEEEEIGLPGVTSGAYGEEFPSVEFK